MYINSMLICLAITILPYFVYVVVFSSGSSVTVNWQVNWVLFLLIINCYPILATIPYDVVLHLTLLCVTWNAHRCVFIYSLIVSMSYILLNIFSKCFRMPSMYLQCFCSIDPGGNVLLLWVLLLHFYCFW